MDSSRKDIHSSPREQKGQRPRVRRVGGYRSGVGMMRSERPAQIRSDQPGLLHWPRWIFSRGDRESWESSEQGVSVFSSPVPPHLSVPKARAPWRVDSE